MLKEQASQILPHLPQTSSTSRSCRPCLSRWGRRSACVCSTAGRSSASTCRPTSCGRTTRWGCAAPSTATFKMTSCKCVPANLWPLPRPALTPPLSSGKEGECSCFRGRERWWSALSLSVMHTSRAAQHQKPRSLISSFRWARWAPNWTHHFNKEFTVSGIGAPVCRVVMVGHKGRMLSNSCKWIYISVGGWSGRLLLERKLGTLPEKTAVKMITCAVLYFVWNTFLLLVSPCHSLIWWITVVLDVMRPKQTG